MNSPDEHLEMLYEDRFLIDERLIDDCDEDDGSDYDFEYEGEPHVDPYDY